MPQDSDSLQTIQTNQFVEKSFFLGHLDIQGYLVIEENTSYIETLDNCVYSVYTLPDHGPIALKDEGDNGVLELTADQIKHVKEILKACNSLGNSFLTSLTI